MTVDKVGVGAFLAVMSGLIIATNALLVKIATNHLSLFVVLFVSFIVSFVVFAIITLMSSTVKLLAWPSRLTVVRASVGITQFFIFYSTIQLIPMVDAMLLRSSSPLWIAVIQVFCFGQAIAKQSWMFLLIGFIGVACVLHPTLTNVSYGYPLGLAAGVLYGVQSMLSRELHSQGEPLLRIMVVIMGIGSLAFAAPALEHLAALTLDDAGLMALITLTLLTSTYFTVQSFKFGPAYVILPFSYSSIMFSALFGWWISDHIPPIPTWIGFVLIMVGAISLLRTARI